jgi:hypothetical protein
MRGRRRRNARACFALFGSTTVAALGLVGTASAAPRGGWLTVPAESVSGQNFVLNAVSVPASGDVWVAGYHWENVGGTTEFRTLAEHFDGSRFVIVPTPDRETAPAVDFLEGVAGTSASDIWAVGSSSPPGMPDQTLVERWNGTSWAIVSSPNPGNAGNILQAVAAISPTDIWAVGASQDSSTFYERPMAIHWDGTAWTSMSLPNPRGCSGHSYLTAVAGAAARDVWAAGWCGSGGSTPQQGYVERWAGGRWKVAAAQGAIPAYSQLYGLSANGPEDVWTVGHTQQSGSSQTVAVAVHWDGKSWRQVPVNLPGTDASLRSIVDVPGQPVWSVGAGSSPQPPFAGPLSVRYGRGVWHAAKVPVAFGSLSGLAVDVGVGQIWAAGTHLAKNGYDLPLLVTRRFT